MKKNIADKRKRCIFAASNERMNDQWCNGSTTVFGTVCLGSNPGWSTLETLTLKVGVFFRITMMMIGACSPYFVSLI